MKKLLLSALLALVPCLTSAATVHAPVVVDSAGKPIEAQPAISVNTSGQYAQGGSTIITAPVVFDSAGHPVQAQPIILVDEAGVYATGGTSGAATTLHYLTSTAEASLSDEINLGALTSGLLKHTVSAGVSTPATAVAGADYVAPGGALGTPSSGTATNLTGLPVGSGISGLGTGVATALAVNVGSAGAPVVNGGALGTPSSGVGTNLTGIPPTGVTGTAAILGANTFTSLQTITQGSVNTGLLASTGYSLTGSNATPAVSIAGTLNTSGAVDAFQLAMTCTSCASANLIHLKGGAAGATTEFKVTGGGALTAAGTGNFGGAVTVSGDTVIGAGSAFAFSTTRSILKSANNGDIWVADQAGSTFGCFQYGGVNSSFPAACRSGTTLKVRLADNSADAPLTAAGFSTTSAGAVSTNPQFNVYNSGTQASVADATVTALSMDTEINDVGSKFASNEWCPGWTGGIMLSVVVSSVSGTTIAGGVMQPYIMKGTTGAETSYLSGPTVLAISTAGWSGGSFAAFDVAAATDCYKAGVNADTASGTSTVAAISRFFGRAF